MTHQQLEQLSRDELVEIILRQQATIIGQQALSDQLQTRVAQLEQLVSRLTQPPRNAPNSSTPPSKTRRPNRSDRAPQKERRPKPGHTGASRTRQEPDVIVQCRPALCDHCGADLPQAEGRLLGTSQVVEIPPLQPVVVEAQRCECPCPDCGHRQAAGYPAGLEPQRVCGPRLEAFVCHFHHVQHVSYERLQRLLQAIFGLSLSQGAIASIIARAAVGLQSQAQAIGQQARASPVIHRKVSGGFRSDWGAAAFATMATVIETAAERGKTRWASSPNCSPQALRSGLSLNPPGYRGEWLLAGMEGLDHISGTTART